MHSQPRATCISMSRKSLETFLVYRVHHHENISQSVSVGIARIVRFYANSEEDNSSLSKQKSNVKGGRNSLSKKLDEELLQNQESKCG